MLKKFFVFLAVAVVSVTAFFSNIEKNISLANNVGFGGYNNTKTIENAVLNNIAHNESGLIYDFSINSENRTIFFDLNAMANDINNTWQDGFLDIRFDYTHDFNKIGTIKISFDFFELNLNDISVIFTKSYDIANYMDTLSSEEYEKIYNAYFPILSIANTAQFYPFVSDRNELFDTGFSITLPYIQDTVSPTILTNGTYTTYSSYDIMQYVYTTNFGYNKFGYNDGYEKGTIDGYDEGYFFGYQTGLQDGYDDGYLQAMEDSGGTYSDGYLVGWDDAYTKGYNIGYSSGYNAGIEELAASNLSVNWFQQFLGGFSALFTIQVFPNIPLGMFVGIPLLLGLVLFIIGIRKGK